MISMPAVVILFVCKTIISAGPVDQNAGFTHHESREWAIENSMMVCRRHEIAMYDPSVDLGADAQPFTPFWCRHSGILQGVKFDEAQKRRHSSWRYWRTSCPTPIVNYKTGQIIGYKMPECPMRGKVRCDGDVAI